MRLDQVLACATPDAWLAEAVARLPELLLDHANCEKKAASTAISLLFRYPQHDHLTHRMSRLAREELRHFEQLQALMSQQGIGFRRVSPSRYAAGLRRQVREAEPQRLVDVLVTGALIEARSCERFRLLAPRLDGEVAALYRRLARSEARHFEQYLELAGRYSAEPLAPRIAALAAAERELVLEPDSRFGFHSGPPAVNRTL